MRTNIVIDDKLMAAAMAAGDFKTKREAVEEGLRLIARRKIYAGLLALRGQLHWDDSDKAWAQAAKEPALENQVPGVQASVAACDVTPTGTVPEPERTPKAARKPQRKVP